MPRRSSIVATHRDDGCYDNRRRCGENPAPLLSGAFDRGEVSWSALREITRVAEEETQEAWLEFSKSKSVRRVKAEVSDALKKGRNIPRR